jgi:hypothetical protein
MSFFSKLFGRGGGDGKRGGIDLDSAVATLSALYNDPEVISERGISITGPRAEEVRAVGRKLYQSGGKESMLAARDRLREEYSWAGTNLERIWSSMPEWQR